MRFKIAIVDQDEIYVARLSKAFGEKHADKLDMYSYTSMDTFEQGKSSNRFDLVLFAEGMIQAEQIPANMNAAYFVSQNDIDKVDGVNAICKFQKHEILLKQIMELCLEQENTHYTKKNVLGNITKVLLVTSACGGVGTTTIATAAARHFARTGKKVLYLSFEKNAMTNLFFFSQEDANFSDVIYMVKSKKSNMISRVENIVQKDESGVYFFQPCRTVFDMNELTTADMKLLLQEFCSMGSYEYIVIDMQMTFDDAGYFICDYADDIVLVSEGTKVGEEKLKQLQVAFNIWDNEKDARFIAKTKLVYNKFSNKTGTQATDLSFEMIGGTPKYEGVNEKQIAEQISNMQFFQKYI